MRIFAKWRQARKERKLRRDFEKMWLIWLARGTAMGKEQAFEFFCELEELGPERVRLMIATGAFDAPHQVIH